MHTHAPGGASALRFLYCRALAAASSRRSSSNRAIDSLSCWLRSWGLIAHGPRDLRPRPMGYTPAPGASKVYIYNMCDATYVYGRAESRPAQGSKAVSHSVTPGSSTGHRQWEGSQEMTSGIQRNEYASASGRTEYVAGIRTPNPNHLNHRVTSPRGVCWTHAWTKQGDEQCPEKLSSTSKIGTL